jgi:hypothetical protein
LLTGSTPLNCEGDKVTAVPPAWHHQKLLGSIRCCPVGTETDPSRTPCEKSGLEKLDDAMPGNNLISETARNIQFSIRLGATSGVGRRPVASLDRAFRAFRTFGQCGSQRYVACDIVISCKEQPPIPRQRCHAAISRDGQDLIALPWKQNARIVWRTLWRSSSWNQPA